MIICGGMQCNASNRGCHYDCRKKITYSLKLPWMLTHLILAI
uniref:Uncharacterized protein n=1 Tax=Rhizophora mucronata TaxID=61149 RepID=A0A2P2QN91_RHIMU